MDRASNKYRPKFGGKPSSNRSHLSSAMSALLVKYANQVLPDDEIIVCDESYEGDEPREDETVALLNLPGVEQTRRSLASCIEAGDLTQSVIDVVFQEGRFTPIEGTLIEGVQQSACAEREARQRNRRPDAERVSSLQAVPAD